MVPCHKSITRAGHWSCGLTFRSIGPAASSQSAYLQREALTTTMRCPQCGALIPGNWPFSRAFECAGCKAPLTRSHAKALRAVAAAELVAVVAKFFLSTQLAFRAAATFLRCCICCLLGGVTADASNREELTLWAT